MNISTVLGLLIAAHFIQVLLGLPVDRELFRVKRKGETDVDHDEELFRKVRRSQDDKEIEIKHKRRFFAPETTDNKIDEVFKTKMEARSSRSSREDNDVTEKRPERFQLRIQKRSSDKSGSHLVTGDTSGSGDQPGEKSTSGSGLWSSKSSLLKQTEKRSMSVNSLSSLISALKAITSLAPEGEGTSGDEINSSGSGFWLAPEKEVDDDKLPKFFQQETNSVSEENPEEALSMISEAAEKELNKKVEDTSSEKTNPATEVNLFRRELKSDLLADDLMSALENNNESHDDQPDDDPTLSSGSAMYEKEVEITEQPEEDEISGQREEQFVEKPEVSSTTEVGSTPEVWSTPEVKPTPDAKSVRSLTEVLLPDSFYRAKRSSQENVFLRSDNYLGVNDALDSDSLVARFYHEQDAHADAPEVTETSVASLPSETEAVSSTEKQAKPEKRETYFEHSGDFSVPRVVYKREIRNAPEPIIERPAVYSRNEDENEMDSSFGGEDDDDDEATLMIHEREIREDGYVGCYEDKSPDRDLPTVLSVPHLTPDSCRSACQGAGHAYAGVQYGYLCRCGDSYGKYTKVPDEECDALCTGDKAQKCGGFWRSAVFTTAGAMQPSKRGNFFHIDSVQPITEDIFDIPRSEIPSGDEQYGETSTMTESATVTESAAPSPEQPAPAHDEQSGETSTITESATVTESAAPSPEQPAPAHDEQSGETSTITESATVTESAAPGPEQPAPAYESTVPESSGAYTQDTHQETSLQESPVPSTPGVTVHESPMPSTSEEMALDDDSVAQALSAQSAKEDVSLAHESVDETTHINEETSRAHKPDSAPANNSAPAHDIMPTSAPADNPEPPPQASQRSNIEAPPQQVTVPLDSPVSINQEASHIQHDQAPQGTHVSQLVYLHQQQDILSKPTPKTIVAVPPGKVEAGTVAYTGTIKLKQSWLDQFEDANSAESKILTGNIEQAFKRVFKNEPKFVNAEVMGFREGLVKHNPNTIRKVIAPFIVTFKNGAEGVEEKLKNMVKNFGKLDDMPVYKNSLQIAEYGHSPAVEKEKTVKTDDTAKEKHKSEEEKRSAVNIPKRPYTMHLFLMKDLFGKKKRSAHELKE